MFEIKNIFLLPLELEFDSLRIYVIFRASNVKRYEKALSKTDFDIFDRHDPGRLQSFY